MVQKRFIINIVIIIIKRIKIKRIKKKIQNIEEELKDLLLNCLSINQNFNLKLSDEFFNLMINNLYFKENIKT